ncbi:uncharacterized protein hemgn isoform X2 [Dunckerocampus dactyliophorus]|uniref:uncharacterized protein hemgn isoform X2 n=1 Tax=Dunckerocampus dactyliophorus TaxID=161453 RepID=UPI0024055705|nr:uncharacterized protein hemgn isoform X2 [Dunckerocampus dactyliophorus]
MEGTSQQATDCKGLNEEEQGGIRRRLRDRELLKRRKAEAEEKTSQLETPRKRQRAEGTKRRGRARKTADTQQSSFMQEGPVVVVLPEPEEAIPATASDLLEAESFLSDVPWVPSATTPGLVSTPDVFTAVPPAPSQDQSTAPAPDLAPEPVSESASAPDLAPELVSDFAREPTPDLTPEPTSAPDPAPEPASDLALDALLVFTQSQAPVSEPASVSSVIPPQVETLMSSQSQAKETLDQVVIEDLGPDDEEEQVKVQSPSQDKRADEDTSEAPSNNEPEQNEIFTVPSLSSLTSTQGYFPGN